MRLDCRSRVSLRSTQATKKMKEAERRQTQGHNRRILRCGARPFGARTLVGVPPRLSPKGIIPSQRLSFRPGFLGRGLYGRYPPSPVPVQGSTSTARALKLKDRGLLREGFCADVVLFDPEDFTDRATTPVLMPGDMMPKPPGSRLQTHPRAPPSLP